jgi:hypothetical protein
MSHYVLVQEPRRKSFYVICGDVDECLIVVDKETSTAPVGTRVTMLRSTGGDVLDVLSAWRVEKRGQARRYNINPVLLRDYGAYCEAVAKAYDKAPLVDANEAWRWKKLAAHVQRFYKRMLTKIDVEFVPGQPYDNAKQMRREVNRTGVLYISTDYNEHPVFTPKQNLKLRAVHDYIVHILPGKGGPDFSQRGEIRAYNLHRRLAPPDTWPALFTEVAAQACYNTVRGEFPVQKIAVLPFDHYNVGAELAEMVANPAMPKPVKSVFDALSSLGAQNPEHFAGAVWSIAYRGSAADAKELLLADGWRMFGRDTGQLSVGQAFAMRKGKRGSPELQVVERYKNVRVTVDLKP